MRPHWCSTCTTSGQISSKPDNTGLRRRFMSSSPSIRHWTNSTPKAASPDAAAVTRKIAAILIDGMRVLGFEPLLPDHLQAPIIVTFRMPVDKNFVFQTFYDRLKDRGYVIYPGKLTVADSFRIGCIGRLYPSHMRGVLAAIREILNEMDVRSLKATQAA